MNVDLKKRATSIAAKTGKASEKNVYLPSSMMRCMRKKRHGKGNSDGRERKNSDANAVAFDAPKKGKNSDANAVAFDASKRSEQRSKATNHGQERTILPTKFIPAPVLRQPMEMSCAYS